MAPSCRSASITSPAPNAESVGADRLRATSSTAAATTCHDRSVESSIDILVPSAQPIVGEWYGATPAAADGMPPHITLLWPWVGHVTGEAVAKLTDALEGVAAFDLSFSGTGQFPGVLYIAPTPSEPLLNLMRRIWSAFPDTPPYGGELGYEPVPHLTAAKGSDGLDAIEAALAQRLREPLSLLVDRISVSQEGASPDGKWAVVAEVELQPR